MWRRVVFFLVGLTVSFSDSFAVSESTYNQSEKVILVTDKPYYCSGETIRYKVFLIRNTSNQQNGILYVDLWDSSGELIIHHNLKITDNSTEGEISISTELGTGNYTLRAYTNYLKNFGEDRFFRLPIFIINSDDYKSEELEELLGAENDFSMDDLNDMPSVFTNDLVIATGNERYSTRDKIQVKLSSKSGTEGVKEMVVLARHTKYYPENSVVEPSVKYLKDHEEDRFEMNDEGAYITEEGLQIDGSYSTMDPDKLYKTITYSIFGKDPIFVSGYTNRAGEFSMDISNCQSNDKVYIGTLDNDIDDIELQENAIIGFIPDDGDKVFHGDISLVERYIKNYQIRCEIDESYKYENINIIDDTLSIYDTTRVYSYCDNIYRLDDYNPFLDVVDMIREIIPYVKLQKKKKKTSVYIFNRSNPELTKIPLFLVNGLPTRDQEFVLNLDISNIDAVELLYSKKALLSFGWIGRGGIMAIYTKTPVSVPNTKAVSVNGIHNKGKIWEIGLNDNVDIHTIPYINPNLYWNPNVRLDNNGSVELEIHAGDETGQVEIIVIGVEQNGKVLYSRKTLNIEFVQ